MSGENSSGPSIYDGEAAVIEAVKSAQTTEEAVAALYAHAAYLDDLRQAWGSEFFASAYWDAARSAREDEGELPPALN